MNCKHATWLLSLRQDRPLSFRERLGLRVHLGYCWMPCLSAAAGFSAPRLPPVHPWAHRRPG